MIKIQLENRNMEGRVKVVRGYKDYKKLYVRRSNLKSWILSTRYYYTLDSMVEIPNYYDSGIGEYHFDTLKELTAALNK